MLLLSFGGGSYFGVTFRSALLGCVEWEGEKKQVGMELKGWLYGWQLAFVIFPLKRYYSCWVYISYYDLLFRLT